MTTLAKASELIGDQFHYGNQMPDEDIFSIINLIERTVSVMYVYILNQHGQPLMPCRPQKNTYGHITKYYRELYHIEKSHINDAIMISKNFNTVPDDTWYVSRAIRKHNRQIHKQKILKGGIHKRNQAAHTIHGLRLFDLVAYDKHFYYVFGRRKTGFMDIRTLDGTKVNKGSISVKKLKYVSTSNMLIERRKAIPLMDESMSSLA